ncbi:MAG: hypothetical protein Q7R49_00025 [Candidatus Daviesbacteria bacterium]|nr:hypothetical protein [Candidatus Daviesbacteria bacterium]
MSEGIATPEEVAVNQGKYETLDIPTIEQPLRILVGQLKNNFENGTYALLIGDDTSGRVPTLIMKNVSDVVTQKRGLPTLPTVFVQAGRYLNDEQVQKQIEDLRVRYGSTTQDKKALLITDYIRSGKTLKRLTELFSDNNMGFDVATLDMDESEEAYRQQGVISPETTVFCGNPGSEHKQPVIWRHPGLVGIEPHADSSINRGGGFEIKGLRLKKSPTARALMGEARRDAKRISAKLIHEFYPQS